MDNRNLYKIFPYLRDKNRFSHLKIDNESLYFISHKYVATKISTIILSYLSDMELKPEDVTITDATAGVGGNTISFCLNFGFCYPIEIDDERCSYLKDNLDVYELKNYKIIKGDCIKQLPKINKQDIVFMDPPWGGKDYKKLKDLRLNLSGIPIEIVIDQIFNSEVYISNPKIVVLKLPLNYDIKYLFEQLKKNKIFIHKLKKMYIIVVINL